MTDVVRVGSSQYSADILLFMQKFRCIFLIFYLMLVNLLGLGISEIRDMFFHGPIWMRLKNSGSCYVGQVPGTSQVAARPKKHICERYICPSLLRPFADGPASSLFVVVQSILDVIRIPVQRYVVIACPVLSPYFLFFLSAGLLDVLTPLSDSRQESVEMMQRRISGVSYMCWTDFHSASLCCGFLCTPLISFYF